MATITCTLVAERWLDEVIVQGSAANVTEWTNNFALPSTLGDVAILCVDYRVTNITTDPTLTDDGVLGTILASAGGQPVDLVGSDKLYRTQEGATTIVVSGFLDPDALVLWRSNEFLQIATPILDAGGTGDIAMRAKCVRVRPIESAPAPLRLVR